jgi:hypothetical protein
MEGAVREAGLESAPRSGAGAGIGIAVLVTLLGFALIAGLLILGAR